MMFNSSMPYLAMLICFVCRASFIHESNESEKWPSFSATACSSSLIAILIYSLIG